MTMPQIEFERARDYDDALARAAAECGIEPEYWDIFHKRHETSSDIRRRILQALGWDVANFETIERERVRRFERKWTSELPRTLVISESDPVVPLTLPASFTGLICFEIVLEGGQRLAGTIETSQLRHVHEIAAGGELRYTYELRLPMEVPIGYHAITITINGNTVAESNVIVCPNRAYVPERLAKNGRIAGFNVALYGLRSNRNWGCGDFADLRATDRVGSV